MLHIISPQGIAPDEITLRIDQKGYTFLNGTAKHRQGCGVTGTLTLSWWGCKCTASLKSCLAIFAKSEYMLIYDPGIPLLRMKTYVNQKTCARAFTCSFVYNIQIGNNPNVCQENNLHRILYSNQSKLLFYAAIRTHLTGTILSKRSQTLSDPI